MSFEGVKMRILALPMYKEEMQQLAKAQEKLGLMKVTETARLFIRQGINNTMGEKK